MPWRLQSTWRSRLAAWTDRRILLLGLVVLGAAFAEGSANDWLGIAMVDGYGLDMPGGALVVAVFLTAMTAGRIAGVGLLDRYGRVAMLRACSALAVVGLVLVVAGASLGTVGLAIGVAGVVLWGLGAALGFPVGLSAAADDPATATASVAVVSTIGYCAFLVGPPVIGFAGQHIGVLHALLGVAVLIALGGLCAAAAAPVRPQEQAPAP